MRYTARAFTVLFCCVLAGSGGCTGTEPEFAEVEGVVTLKGKPTRGGGHLFPHHGKRDEKVRPRRVSRGTHEGRYLPTPV